jgi:hypothetical protein
MIIQREFEVHTIVQLFAKEHLEIIQNGINKADGVTYVFTFSCISPAVLYRF